MSALNQAFIKAFRAPGTGRMTAPPATAVSASTDPADSRLLGGQLYTCETWTVAPGIAVPQTCGFGVEQVAAEEPIHATVLRVDSPRRESVPSAQPTRGQRLLNSPHWVFVPVTRPDQAAAPTESRPRPAEQTEAEPATQTPVAETAAESARAADKPGSKVTFLFPESDADSAGSDSPKERIEDASTITPPAKESRHPWLRPALEVDRFRWPDVCEGLIAFAGDSLDRCVRKLLATARGGRRVVMISGQARGEGRTTLLLCLARRLSAAGLKTALVDGDFANPQLAGRLGLVPEIGWQDVLQRRVSLCEAMIDSLEDKLSLLPAAGQSAPEQSASASWQTSLEALAAHYQIVLLDAPPLDELLGETSDGDRAACRGIDSALLVQSTPGASAPRIDEMARRLRLAGVATLGMVGNFAQEQAQH